MLVIFYLLFLYSILLLLLSEVGFFNDLNDREIFNVMMTRCQKCGIIIPRNRRENWRSESRKKEDAKEKKKKKAHELGKKCSVIFAILQENSIVFFSSFYLCHLIVSILQSLLCLFRLRFVLLVLRSFF